MESVAVGDGVGSKCGGMGSAHRLLLGVLVVGCVVGDGVGNKCGGMGSAHRLVLGVLVVGVCGW